MTWAQRQAQVYPDDEGVKARMMWMPVESPPERPRVSRIRRRKSPVPGCPDCDTEPCERHAVCDPLATIGGTQ